MRIESITDDHCDYVVTYKFFGYRMCRAIVASSEKDAESKLRETLNIDEVLSIEKCV